MKTRKELEKIIEVWTPRASEVYSLVAGSSKGLITDKQRDELALLREKSKTEKGLTARQEVRMKELVKKEKAEPELSEGAKTFLREKVVELVFDRRKDIVTRQMVKGNMLEDDAIRLLGDYLGAELKKNKKRYVNDLVNGEPDVIKKVGGRKVVYDTKVSWDLFTFPLLSDKLDEKYKWQVKSYLMLTGAEVGFVAYVLMDAPEHFIADELRRRGWLYDTYDLDDEEVDRVRKLYIYNDIPMEMRIKLFKVELNKDDEKLVGLLVKKARVYMNNMLNEIYK